MDELTPVEIAVAKLARVNALMAEATTVLAIEDANRRAHGKNGSLSLVIHSLDKMSSAINLLARSVVADASPAPVAQGKAEPKREFNDVARDVQSALENLTVSPARARAFVLAAIDQVGDADFDILFSACMKMVRQ